MLPHATKYTLSVSNTTRRSLSFILAFDERDSGPALRDFAQARQKRSLLKKRCFTSLLSCYIRRQQYLGGRQVGRLLGLSSTVQLQIERADVAYLEFQICIQREHFFGGLQSIDLLRTVRTYVCTGVRLQANDVQDKVTCYDHNRIDIPCHKSSYEEKKPLSFSIRSRVSILADKF